jgi:hypothetical protein
MAFELKHSNSSYILSREAYYYVNGVTNKYGGNVRNNMCNLPSISDLLYRQDVRFLHKCMLGIVDLPVFSDNRITVRSKSSKLRGGNSTQLIVPTINVGYYNNSCFPRSVALYNKLPESIKSLSIKDFQAKIKLFILLLLCLFFVHLMRCLSFICREVGSRMGYAFFYPPVELFCLTYDFYL